MMGISAFLLSWKVSKEVGDGEDGGGDGGGDVQHYLAFSWRWSHSVCTGGGGPDWTCRTRRRSSNILQFHLIVTTN